MYTTNGVCQPNLINSSLDPVSRISQLLKAAIAENTSETKKELETLAECHDGAKLLIERMTDSYRNLKVHKIIITTKSTLIITFFHTFFKSNIANTTITILGRFE